MTYVSDLPRRGGALATGPDGVALRLFQMLRMSRRVIVHPAAAQPLSTGPATEALIDADMERMASFGSWAALRDELRARDQARLG